MNQNNDQPEGTIKVEKLINDLENQREYIRKLEAEAKESSRCIRGWKEGELGWYAMNERAVFAENRIKNALRYIETIDDEALNPVAVASEIKEILSEEEPVDKTLDDSLPIDTPWRWTDEPTPHQGDGRITIYNSSDVSLFSTPYWNDTLANSTTKAFAVRHAQYIIELANNNWFPEKWSKGLCYLCKKPATRYTSFLLCENHTHEDLQHSKPDINEMLESYATHEFVNLKWDTLLSGINNLRERMDLRKDENKDLLTKVDNIRYDLNAEGWVSDRICNIRENLTNLSKKTQEGFDYHRNEHEKEMPKIVERIEKLETNLELWFDRVEKQDQSIQVELNRDNCEYLIDKKDRIEDRLDSLEHAIAPKGE